MPFNSVASSESTLLLTFLLFCVFSGIHDQCSLYDSLHNDHDQVTTHRAAPQKPIVPPPAGSAPRIWDPEAATATALRQEADSSPTAVLTGPGHNAQHLPV